MEVLILNSAGFSDLGWVTETATQRVLVDSLSRAGLDVAMIEVAGTDDVDRRLSEVSDDTLVWPNAYYVRDRDSGELRWLAQILEARGAAFVGSPAAALQTVLHKDDCQARLAAAGVPIPRFAVVTRRDPEVIRAALEAADLSWPVVVKPTSTAGSVGVAVATEPGALAAGVADVLDHHGPRAIVEQYMPSNDVTVGVLTGSGGAVLLPTWYEMVDREPGAGILDRRDRLRSWGGAKQMRPVVEPDVLEQIEAVIPRAVAVLGIRDVTRIDGRLDENGVLRIFDVNGMPAFDYPDAVLLRQVMTLWQETHPLTALDRAVATLVASAAERYGFEVPGAVTAKALPCRFNDRRQAA